MKMTFATLCLSGAVALAFGTLAQAQSSSDQKDMSKSMKITGCLREAAGASGEFELTNVDKSGTSEKSDTYKLVAGSVNLKDHVGHKVEITGTPDTGAGEKAPTSTAGPEKIKVTALKHISPTCEASK
jgi:hypothetical protein